MENLKHTINALVQKGEQRGYVAFCVDLPVVTQGETMYQEKLKVFFYTE